MRKEQIIIPTKRKVMVGIPIKSTEVEMIRTRISEDIGLELPKMKPHFTLIPPRTIPSGQDFSQSVHFQQCCVATAEVACKIQKTSVTCTGYNRFRRNMLYLDVKSEPIEKIYQHIYKTWGGFKSKIPKSITPHLTLVKDCPVDTYKITELLGRYSYDPVKYGFSVEIDRVCVYTKVGGHNYTEESSYELIR